jgi:hypothetical protein
MSAGFWAGATSSRDVPCWRIFVKVIFSGSMRVRGVVLSHCDLVTRFSTPYETQDQFHHSTTQYVCIKSHCMIMLNGANHTLHKLEKDD